jgi:uncharacterized protein YlxW (UPF0749 family)
MISTRAKLTLSLTVVSMVLGFMISIQYKQQIESRLTGGTIAASDTEQKKMMAELTALKTSNTDAQSQLGKLTTQLSGYERAAGSNSSLQDQQKRLEAERILAGSTPVTGPGVSVTLMDGLATGTNIRDYLTHDWEVRSVINELFTAGAEAVSINGYRVVATSGVFCVGPVVKVNDHRLSAPFQIEAIGEPQYLKSALTMQGGVLDSLRSTSQIKVSDPQVVQAINMPAFTGSLLSGSTN